MRQKMRSGFKTSLYTTWVFLSLIIVLGLFLRFDAVIRLQGEPSEYLADGKPVLVSYDGYYYLSKAKDLVSGAEDFSTEQLRRFPDGVQEKAVPPLLSFVTAWLAQLGHWDLANVAVTLPPLLSILTVFPMYVTGAQFGGPIAGIVAAAVLVVDRTFLARSSYGRYDTDCLILFFCLTLSCLGCKLISTRSWRNTSVLLCCFLLASILFFFWWDQAPLVVTVFSSAVLLMVVFGMCALHWRNITQSRIVYVWSLFVLLIITALLVWNWAYILEILGDLFNYVTMDSSNCLKNYSVLNAEQQAFSYRDIVDVSSGSSLLFIFSLIGFANCLHQRRVELVVLLPILGIAGLGVAFASRFLLFLAPVYALGVGVMMGTIARRFSHSIFAGILVFGVVLLCLYFPIVNHGTTVRYPPVHPQVVKELEKIKDSVPFDGVIWAWNDVGYPLIYYTQRKTIADGGTHSALRVAVNAIPFSTDKPRLAANLMNFVVQHGVEAIRTFAETVGLDHRLTLQLLCRILEDGPLNAQKMIESEEFPWTRNREVGDWMKFFFPRETIPLFILTDWNTIKKSEWIYFYGMLDPRPVQTILEEIEIPYFFSIETDRNGLMYFPGNVLFRKNEGAISIINENFTLFSYAVSDAETTRSRLYSDEPNGKKHLEISLQAGLGIVMSGQSSRRLLNRLHWRHFSDEEEKYFEPVVRSIPYLSLWRIHADSFE